MNQKKNIWLIRHAESESNAGMYTSCPASIPLSPKGFEQARNIVNKFTKPPELIITSSYIRTKQTAEPVVKKYRHVPCEEWEIQEFTYLSPDKCKSTTRADRLPMVKEYWSLCDPFYCDGNGAESFNDFIKRVRFAIYRLKRRKEKFIALFSHGQFIAAVLWLMKNNIREITPKEIESYYKLLQESVVPNAGIEEISF